MFGTLMKQKNLRLTLLLGVVLLFAACATSGVTDDTLSPDNSVVEAGNPPAPKPRKLEGTTTSNHGVCTADAIEVYDTADRVVTAEIDSDCAFSTSVNSGKAWGVRFYRHDALVGTMVFQNGQDLPLSFVYYTSDESSSVNFGEVRFSTYWAFPEVQPATQNDRDGDGQSDYDDADDDNDGTLDAAETDCDGNHIWDDLEEPDC